MDILYFVFLLNISPKMVKEQPCRFCFSAFAEAVQKTD